MNNKSCYIVTFYLGNRRNPIISYNDDKLAYLKLQIKTLSEYRHNLSKIIFNFNLPVEHYDLFNEALKIIPKKIQNTDVEIIIRENLGFSYAGFAHCHNLNKDNYEYFFFVEDDYFFIQDDWDSYMIDKFESLPNAGYLCGFVREPSYWNEGKKFAAPPTGLASKKSIDIIIEKFGQIPHVLDNDYSNQEALQIDFTNVYEQAGLRLYDIREEFRCGAAKDPNCDHEVDIYFFWNEQFLIVPAIMIAGYQYTVWEPYDGEFQVRTNTI